MPKTNEEIEEEGCKYCGTMWFELRSEGAPCGINNCDVFNCCDKAFKDHVKQCHPEEYAKLFGQEKEEQHKNVNNTKRPSWDEYFINIAKVVSSRSACFRAKCGAVIVKNKAIVSTGYNGAPKHQKNCEEIGFCYRDKNNIVSGTQLERCRACGSHSESNAIALASKLGHSTEGATMYVYGNTAICTQCRGIIANAGIIRVVYMNKDGKILEIIPERDWTIHPIDKIY